MNQKHDSYETPPHPLSVLVGVTGVQHIRVLTSLVY